MLQASFKDFQVKQFRQEGLARKYFADRGLVQYWDQSKDYKRARD